MCEIRAADLEIPGNCAPGSSTASAIASKTCLKISRRVAEVPPPALAVEVSPTLASSKPSMLAENFSASVGIEPIRAISEQASNAAEVDVELLCFVDTSMLLSKLSAKSRPRRQRQSCACCWPSMPIDFSVASHLLISVTLPARQRWGRPWARAENVGSPSVSDQILPDSMLMKRRGF